jgi:hypothetical protein
LKDLFSVTIKLDQIRKNGGKEIVEDGQTGHDYSGKKQRERPCQIQTGVFQKQIAFAQINEPLL